MISDKNSENSEISFINIPTEHSLFIHPIVTLDNKKELISQPSNAIKAAHSNKSRVKNTTPAEIIITSKSININNGNQSPQIIIPSNTSMLDITEDNLTSEIIITSKPKKVDVISNKLALKTTKTSRSKASDITERQPLLFSEVILFDKVPNLLYDDIVDNISMQIASESPDMLHEANANHFLFKELSPLPFSGCAKKISQANRLILKPKLIKAQYLSKNDNGSKPLLSGMISKSHITQPLINDNVIKPQYIFAADNINYQLSGTVQKSSSLYIQ